MCQVEDWKISLGTRNNLLYNDIPYIPVLVEDIAVHIAFDDYEENGIKTIQTVGELIPKSECRATLSSLTPGNSSTFPVSFKNLSVNDIYVKDSSNKYCLIWEKYMVFKVYGILKIEDEGCMLETTHLVPIHDVEGTCNVMALLIAITCSEYRHYYRTNGQSDVLESQWKRMKEEKRRLVKEELT